MFGSFMTSCDLCFAYCVELLKVKTGH